MASIRSLRFNESEWFSPNDRGGDLFSAEEKGKHCDFSNQEKNINTYNQGNDREGNIM